jgi:predicted phage tail protein
MKVVKVYGALRKKLGQCRFEFDADTPAQVLKALCVNFPSLEKWLIDSEQNGVGYRVTIGKEKIVDNNVQLIVCPFSEREVFSITPVIAGAGQGAGQILAGIGLVALAIVAAPLGAGFLGLGAGAFTSTTGTALVAGTATGFFTTAALSAASTLVGGLGAYLIFSGISQAISPTPQFSSFERGRDAAKLESFSFSGIVNTAKQGLPVPIAYGRLFVGSAVISSGLDVEFSPNSPSKPTPSDFAFFSK